MIWRFLCLRFFQVYFSVSVTNCLLSVAASYASGLPKRRANTNQPCQPQSSQSKVDAARAKKVKDDKASLVPRVTLRLQERVKVEGVNRVKVQWQGASASSLVTF